MVMMRRVARRTARRTARRQSAFAGAQGAPEEEEVYEDEASDPVQTLKDRLAKGEITLDEYNQMLEAITK